MELTLNYISENVYIMDFDTCTKEFSRVTEF